jgi:Fic family protein
MPYNWQLPDWPHFHYDLPSIEDNLYLFAEKIGHISAALNTLPQNSQLETLIDILVTEALKTSEIEGEYLSPVEVKSSIRNNLGLNEVPENIKDQRAAGIGQLMIDVRKTYMEPLTKEKLWQWHQMLLSSANDITIGGWRTHNEPMQVVSGALGRQRIYYEAPPSSRVPEEMENFITWFNKTAPGGQHEIKKPPVRAALIYLYFESIHPFEDGNGRIGRALAEKSLSQGLGRPVLLSLSRTIEKNKKAYYAALETAQQDNEVTSWMQYFVQVCVDAQSEAAEEIDFTLKKGLFFNRHQAGLNPRQLLVVRRMLEEGPKGFEGGMSASKYMAITKSSKATATRDLQDMAEKAIFLPIGGGRSTRYQLIL